MFREGEPTPESNFPAKFDEAKPEMVSDELAPKETADLLLFSDKNPPDFALASYFREKGPQVLMSIYGSLSGEHKQRLKGAIQERDLSAVVDLIEENDPMNRKAQSAMTKKEDRSEYEFGDQRDAKYLDSRTNGDFELQSLKRRLVGKHQKRASEWQTTGMAPGIEGGLPGSSIDSPAIRKKFAEMPLDIRNNLEALHPTVRRAVISDEELLNMPMETLIKEFPELGRRFAAAFRDVRGWEDPSHLK